MSIELGTEKSDKKQTTYLGGQFFVLDATVLEEISGRGSDGGEFQVGNGEEEVLVVSLGEEA